MLTREDIESFFIRMGVEYNEVDEGLWVLPSADDGTNLVVRYESPLLLLRVKIMTLPEDAGADARLVRLYRRLLELNATDIVHGSYGIDADEVILSHALELETLDFHELRSSYESLLLAASSHTPGLVELVPVAHEA